MSDPDNYNNGPAGRSQVGGATTATSTLLDLPQELILRLASLLEVKDLLALRMVGFNLDNPKPSHTHQVQTEPQIYL